MPRGILTPPELLILLALRDFYIYAQLMRFLLLPLLFFSTMVIKFI